MRRALATAALLAAALAPLVAGCDDAEDGGPATGPATADGTGPGTADVPDVPDECRTPFPQAFAPADLGELALLPDGFPEPPVEATLCITAETLGGSHETASYATPASAEEVLAGYESALAAYDPVRDEDGLGRPIVTATDGDLVIQVTPQAGGFVLALAR